MSILPNPGRAESRPESAAKDTPMSTIPMMILGVLLVPWPVWLMMGLIGSAFWILDRPYRKGVP